MTNIPKRSRKAKSLGLIEAYQLYVKTADSPLPYKEYRKICEEYNKALMRRVLEEGERAKLPMGLGYIRVHKAKMNYNYMKFDYGTFNATGLKTYHVNDHSDDFKARILWEKSKSIHKGKKPYCLILTRQHKRRLAEIMKTDGGHKAYIEYTNMRAKRIARNS